MTLEQAITLALEYENKVRDAYYQAAEQAKDEVGKRVFKVLGDEEQGHIDYLKSKLGEWKSTGTVAPDKLDTVVPPQHVIDAGLKKLDSHLSKPDHSSEIELFSKALQLEKETSAFYQNMVAELGEDGKFFARFIEIEKGHVSIVQAEIDFHNKSGYFFDFQDFQMV
jgi:rubrerythrin